MDDHRPDARTPPLPDWARGLAMARPAMAAGVVYRDDAGRVLLVDPAYKPLWDIPGGIIEPGESPSVAARREIGEELGADLPVGALLVVDWCPDQVLGDKVLWLFDGGVLEAGQLAGVRVDGQELLEARLHDVEELAAALPAPLLARLEQALLVQATGAAAGARYLEHGTPVP